MTITITRLMKLAVVVAGMTLAATFVLASARARTSTDDFDAAATYRAKCFACHGAKAEKKFDATKAEDELVQTVLKGKKVEKPPNMPGYEEKGITAAQAKALVAYMKSIQ